MAENLYCRLTRMRTGRAKNDGTALSISGCVFMKFTAESERVLLSSTHDPGLFSGIFSFSKGSQFEFILSWPLNGPSNASMISLIEKAHTAEPPIAFCGVVKTAYMISFLLLLLPYIPFISSVVASEIRNLV